MGVGGPPRRAEVAGEGGAGGGHGEGGGEAGTGAAEGASGTETGVADSAEEPGRRRRTTRGRGWRRWDEDGAEDVGTRAATRRRHGDAKANG